MNKASKHIQSGVGMNLSNVSMGVSSNGSGILSSSSATQKNVINSIMSFLPDNRPITSLQIVEDFERCPKNFQPIHRTYDQDADADLWRDYNILFGRQTTRYLCLSKTEGLPEYVVETLKVVADKMQPREFSLLSRTADTEQKAWRKRQIAYKLSKRGTVTHAVTDIILCSKLKQAPDGFKLAGDINGVLICYKTGAIPVRLPPPVPTAVTQSQKGDVTLVSKSEVEQALQRLKLQRNSNGLDAGNWPNKGPLPPVPADAVEHDYEEILASYQLNSPQRPAPLRPAPDLVHNVGTLGTYTELEGVPFVLHAALKPNHVNELPILPEISALLKQLDYDFQLERQTLCTMKSSASKNPFFQLEN